MGETLVLSNGGAIAVWSPTGLSINSVAVAMNEALLTEAYAGGSTVELGEAVKATLGGFTDTSFDFMLKIYNVLGDPAVDIR